MKKRIGNFEVYVTAPHPCWVTITYKGQEIGNIPHTELRDLEFVVQRAISAARLKLPDADKDEMD